MHDGLVGTRAKKSFVAGYLIVNYWNVCLDARSLKQV